MGSLFLVRHATTRSSEDGTNLGQRTDAPLLPAGVALARRAGAAVRAELEAMPFGELRAISSPARRCRETARLVLESIGRADLEPGVDAGLWEIDYGDWEGLTADECRRRDPELRARWESDPYGTRAPGGESGADVARRSFMALAPLEAWLSRTVDGVAVVVSHNHVVRLRIAAQMGLPLTEYRRRIEASPGAYSVITFAGERSTVRRLNVLPR